MLQAIAKEYIPKDHFSFYLFSGLLGSNSPISKRYQIYSPKVSKFLVLT